MSKETLFPPKKLQKQKLSYEIFCFWKELKAKGKKVALNKLVIPTKDNREMKKRKQKYFRTI